MTAPPTETGPTNTGPTEAESSETRPDPQLLVLAGVLILGLAAPLLDSTIVNVALRTLSRDLHVSVSTIQWVSTGYLLAMAMAIPITGWASERFGTRRVWIAALVLFTLGSVLSGMAWNVESLITFRVVQGAGTGLMMPILMTVLVQAAGGRTEGMGGVMALISLPTLLGPVLGPVLGGLILDHLSWRWIFYVNPPICLLAIVLAWRILPRAKPHEAPRLDVTGLLLLSPSLAAMIYGLAQVGNQGGFDHRQVLVPAGIGAALLVAFVGHALRTQDPLVDLRLFRVRSFTVSSVLLFLAGLSAFGAMFLLPLYYQELRGESVATAGLLMAPQGLGIALSRASGSLLDRLGGRPVILAGIVLLAAGTLPFGFAGPDTNAWLLAAVLVVRGTGLGVVIMAVMLGSYTDLGPAQIPHASSATRIMQQLGGSFGTAVLAVILQRQLASHSGPAGASAAFQHTFWWALGFTLISIVPALLIPGRRPGPKAPAAEPTAAEPATLEAT